MFNSEKEFLSLYGWDGFFESQISESDLSFLYPARVINEERNLYRVQWGMNKTRWANVTGKLQFNAKGRIDFPAVGDWVLIEVPEMSDRAVIHSVLPRKGLIQRKQAGRSSDAQVLAANVDTIFIAMSMNEDLNPRRLERYLTVAWESQAVPVILLTKYDICQNADVVVSDIQTQFPGVDVFKVSKDRFEEALFFKQYLRKGKTSVVVGSSGVGKSTLANYLIGREELKTQDIREDDGKGRHTTTSRALFLSRYDGLIIDTPGMRELSLSDHQEGLQTEFADVEEIIAQCRFTDCQHKTEPGCAVQKALQEETLKQGRWNSYLKLAAEIRHAIRKQDRALLAEDRKAWKKITVQAGEWGKMKRSIK